MWKILGPCKFMLFGAGWGLGGEQTAERATISFRPPSISDASFVPVDVKQKIIFWGCERGFSCFLIYCYFVKTVQKKKKKEDNTQ